ncbi:MAG: universal stress protein [Chitinophagaceae bacterium]|nr:universal stress protein [Chitinophagaceae bacterium]
MKKLFNHMLVPVDWVDDEGILQQAFYMADRLQCQVHLLYHVPTAHCAGVAGKLKASIRERHPFLTDPSISLEVNTEAVFPEKQIVEYSLRHSVDLILLVRKKRPGHPLFYHPAGADIDRLVDRTHCPVLSVLEQPSFTSLKNIVLPVGDHLPMRQLLFATYLGRTVNSTIHLVAPGSSDPGFAVEARGNLHKCYRLLRENTNLSIECMASPGEDLERAVWDYARKIKADLILTSPGAASMFSGFWNKLRGKLLRRFGSRPSSDASQIPVMTIGNLS